MLLHFAKDAWDPQTKETTYIAGIEESILLFSFFFFFAFFKIDFLQIYTYTYKNACLLTLKVIDMTK